MAQDKKTKRDASGAGQAAPKAAAGATGGGFIPLTFPAPTPAPAAEPVEDILKSAEPLKVADAEPAVQRLSSLSVGPANPPASEPGIPPPIPPVVDGYTQMRPGIDPETPARRVARRRPAGPVRGKIAANDDAPSIGGLIYALEQKPSGRPFQFAAIAGGIWAIVGGAFAWLTVSAQLSPDAGLADVLAKPATFLTLSAIVVPIVVVWFLALLATRAEELRLRSSTMTEVAIRLAEPDKMAEQSVASLGQAVRRQVSFMNDAVSRALGRAGELEALVHNEVSALERSYEENERKIRGLIKELTGERNELLTTSERVTDTLKSLGTEVPTLIEKLSNQQVKLAQIIQGASENLTTLESSLGASTTRLETSLGSRTEQLQTVLEDYTNALGYALGNRTDRMQTMLEDYTGALATALGSRTEQMQAAFEQSMRTLDASIGNRTDNLQAVFEEYARALDTTLANRADVLDAKLIERTRSLDLAFEERLRLFDQAIMRSTMAIDDAVGEKQRALTSALDSHAKTFGETIARQAIDLDESLMHGINTVRRTSENITRQSLKAIEGLAGQSEMLKNVSENLLGQIHQVTNRFENQGQVIMRSANALEATNFKIDSTLQTRHADLSRTLDRLAGKADEFGRFIEGYSSSIEGSLTEAEMRARAAAEELKLGTEARQRAALADIEHMKALADSESQRTLEDLRQRFSTVSNEVSRQFGSLTNRFDENAEDMRQRTARAANEIAQEQERLRRELEQLPVTTRESTEAMRRALHDQLTALDQLSSLARGEAARRDIAPPIPGSGMPGGGEGRSLTSLTSSLAQELGTRSRRQPPPPSAQRGMPTGALPPPSPGTAAPGDERSQWSLGDLLARASHDEDHPPGPTSSPSSFQFNVDVISRALDPATASAVWARFRAGQRGIMVRSIYSAEGRIAFDEVNRRYKVDPELQKTINRYLADFEGILRDAEQKDPSGRAAQSHLVSDTGRVYLFLAHASGRLV